NRAYRKALAYSEKPEATPGLVGMTQARAELLQELIPNEITVAVGAALDEKGNLQWIIATSSPETPPDLIGPDQPDDVLVLAEDHWAPKYTRKEDAQAREYHAERDLIKFAKERAWKLLTIGTKNNHCGDCWEALIQEGIVPTGRPKIDRRTRQWDFGQTWDG